MKRYLFLIILSLLLFLPLFAQAGDEAVNPAKSWDMHFNLYLILVAGVWLVVTIPLIYFSFKYRRKKPEEDGAYIPGNTLLEIVWTVVPLIIILLLGVQTWAIYKEYRKVPGDAYELNVEGFMWGWNVTYPEGIKTTNEVRVPVGRPVKVNLTSRDVLHAFYIPNFRVQEEAIPGRTTYFWFRPVKTGEYPAYCTEFCGSGHSLMLAKVIAMEKKDFEEWTVQQKGAVAILAPAEKGKKLMQDVGCLGCHTVTGEKSTGPTFKGMYGRETILADGRKFMVDDRYIEQKILDPKTTVVKGYPVVMPPYKFPAEDLHAIIEYLKTL